MTTQKINFRTNYNNKLACPHFIHLDVAPPGPVPESKLENTVIVISTLDQSHPPVEKKVVDLLRIKFDDVTGLITHISHGMTKEEFVQLAAKEKKSITKETLMAIYYYSPALQFAGK